MVETLTSPSPSPIKAAKLDRQLPKMYLAEEDWSPRFEPSTFYSFKMNSYVLLKEPPSAAAAAAASPAATTTSSSSSSSTAEIPPGKSTFPAYYYKIVVLCGHSSRIVLRRYSQFKWLYDQLPRNIVNGTTASSASSNNNTNSNNDGFDDDDDDDEVATSPPLSFPPPTWTCCQPQNDNFAQNRLEELRQFLRDTLIRTSSFTSSSSSGGSGSGGGRHRHQTTTDDHRHNLLSTIVSFLELDALVDEIDVKRTATIQNLV